MKPIHTKTSIWSNMLKDISWLIFHYSFLLHDKQPFKSLFTCLHYLKMGGDCLTHIQLSDLILKEKSYPAAIEFLFSACFDGRTDSRNSSAL